mgnify:CR=1 FL=1
MNRIEKQKIKREERRKWSLKYLGGECVECFSVSDLEFDHIDRFTKKHNVSSLFSSSINVLKEELDKCQLLCDKHHNDKTLREKGMIRAVGVHGTISSYRYCHCSKCKDAHAAYQRGYSGWEKRVPSQHGSYSKYKNGCKCKECKSANNTYMKNFYKTRKALLT